jgi:pullulanase/glycogen debranching enzyme
VAYAAPSALSLSERVRMAMLAQSLVGLGQGVPFFLAGDELLRTKSMDSDSYNSGDWFNRLDFSMASNHWGMGLLVADKNRDRWGTIRPLLARADPRAGRPRSSGGRPFEEVLALRRMSPLFRLRTAADIRRGSVSRCRRVSSRASSSCSSPTRWRGSPTWTPT